MLVISSVNISHTSLNTPLTVEYELTGLTNHKRIRNVLNLLSKFRKLFFTRVTDVEIKQRQDCWNTNKTNERSNEKKEKIFNETIRTFKFGLKWQLVQKVNKQRKISKQINLFLNIFAFTSSIKLSSICSNNAKIILHTCNLSENVNFQLHLNLNYIKFFMRK